MTDFEKTYQNYNPRAAALAEARALLTEAAKAAMADGTLAEAERPVPSGDEDDRRGGAVLEAVDLMRELRGKVLLQIEDGVFALAGGDPAESVPRLVRAVHGEYVQPERFKAHNGLSAAHDADLIHSSHAAFLSVAPGRYRPEAR